MGAFEVACGAGGDAEPRGGPRRRPSGGVPGGQPTGTGPRNPTAEGVTWTNTKARLTQLFVNDRVQ